MLASIVNALAAFTGLLEDYHFIEQAEITAGLNVLTKGLPPPARLVIRTRAYPDMPLGRLRARGRLVEIRESDLRFTGPEVQSYLNGAVGQFSQEQLKVVQDFFLVSTGRYRLPRHGEVA